MKLSKISVKGLSFSHPLFHIAFPSALKEEEKPALILKIRAGNKDAADKVILSHVRLALTIAGRYLTKGRSRIAPLTMGYQDRDFCTSYKESDDLVSASLEGLCHGVNKIKTEGLPHNNLTGYLTETMHRFISEYLDHLPVVRVPGRTKRDRRLKGTGIKQPESSQLTEKIIEIQFDKKINTTSQLELDEILDKIAQSPTERTIIQLRIEGHKDDWIADYVGLCKTSVFLIRRDLESRFVTLFGDS